MSIVVLAGVWLLTMAFAQAICLVFRLIPQPFCGQVIMVLSMMASAIGGYVCVMGGLL